MVNSKRRGSAPVRPASSEARAVPSAAPGWVSSNWSGYAIQRQTKNAYRVISGCWIVPRVRPGKRSKFSSAWLGIDGFNNASLIQTGTSHDFRNGKAVYYPWWEILPAAETVISRPVSAGDRIYARIAKISGKKWLIVLANRTKGWTFRKTVAYGGPGTSAEWILEAPTVDGSTAPLANYGKIRFRQCRVNRRSPRLKGSQRGLMVQNRRIVSTPSLPNKTRDGFAVAYGASMPKPPR